MKKTYQATLVLVLLTAVIGVSVASANGPVYIFPMAGGTVNVDTTTTVGIWWGWLATTPGLARIYVNSVYNEYTLLDADSNVVWHLDDTQADAIWSELMSFPSTDWGLVCPSGRLFAHSWQTEIGTLGPGTYTLISEVGTSQPVNDGYHTCTDLAGDPVVDTPSLIPPGVETYVVTIIVSSP